MAASQKRKQIERKREYKNSYSDGNVAYEIAPSYQPQTEGQTKNPKSVKKREHHSVAFFHYFKLIVSVFVVFAGCLLIMVSFATVTQQRVQNQKLKEELSAIQNENNSEEAELINQINLDYVAKQAKERLGMSEPQSYQVIYIDVPKQSYTVQYSTPDAGEKSSFSFDKLINFLKRE